ncbi:tetratricopeptide repeat protein [Ligilactobacillus faecis]|uniref:Tetratricopeptide repeat protein n=1 Tax=Ligilactobacillus faecis TaxID=762833 RepID=A0ABV4DNH5_9LACO
MEKRQKEAAKLDAIIQKLIKKIDADPYDEESYYALGVALTEKKSFEQAEELFKRALNALKEQPQKLGLLHYGLGNVYYASALYDEALKEFSLVKDDKLKAEAYLMLAQTYYAKGEHQKGLAFALTADESKASFETKRLLGDCLLAVGSFEKARQMYEQALSFKADDANVNFQLGVLAVVLGADPKVYFERAKQADPKLYERLQTRLGDIEKLLQNKKKQ